jgi:hypothetical protein
MCAQFFFVSGLASRLHALFLLANLLRATTQKHSNLQRVCQQVTCTVPAGKPAEDNHAKTRQLACLAAPAIYFRYSFVWQNGIVQPARTTAGLIIYYFWQNQQGATSQF